MKTSVFLSHNHKDKDFVRKLARDIDAHGIKVWIDEAEMKITKWCSGVKEISSDL